MGRHVPGRLKPIEKLTLADVEAVRLVLRGDSIIDWHRLNLETLEEARRILRAHELDPDEPADRARMESVKHEAIAFLRRQFDFPIPKPVARATVEELLLIASGQGHRQLCACTILKAMHVIHHAEGRELLFCVPLSDQDVFRLVEDKVYRVVGGMLSAGFPITEFVGGRKNKDSLYTKLLSKRNASASEIYDKLRFRIVTRDASDILPVLHYLTEHLFPFSMCVAGESKATIFDIRGFCLAHPHLRPMVKEFQTGRSIAAKAAGTGSSPPVPIETAEGLADNDNEFSAPAYRVIHFVVDLPIRLPADVLEAAPPAAWTLGPVIFVLCEFQVVDRETEASNERGEASHDAYKERQRDAVMQRLKLGVRPQKVTATKKRR
jgi:uncharacterized protein (TIGR04562 family)